ncbi:MAG: hypothetical protein ACKOAD_07960, partial [Gammaproteobacteria bacterium]
MPLLAVFLVENLEAQEKQIVRILEVQNRPAQEIVEVLKPLLKEGEGIKVLDQKLILKTSEENY